MKDFIETSNVERIDSEFKREFETFVYGLREDIEEYLMEYLRLNEKNYEVSHQSIKKVKDQIYTNLNKFLFKHQEGSLKK